MREVPENKNRLPRRHRKTYVCGHYTMAGGIEQMKLYELSKAYQNLLDMQDELDEQTFTDTLETIQDEVEHKAENTAKIIRTMEAEAKALKEEEERLAYRRKSIENRIRRLKDYLLDNLEASGVNKVKGKHLSVRIQKTPPSVNILDEKAIPEQFYVEQQPKLNKKALIEELKNGGKITGAELIQKRSLRIG